MNVARFSRLNRSRRLVGILAVAVCLSFGAAAMGQEELAAPAPVPVPAPAPVEEAPSQPAVADPQAASAIEPQDDNPPKKVKRKLKFRGRVHAGYVLSREEGQGQDDSRSDLENSFVVERARLKMTWDPYTWLRGVVQIGVDERLELGSSLLRDAYIHLSPLPQLELRIGQFKKPFSALELMSPAKIKVVDRGIGNKLVMSDLRYGGRDLGFMLTGRLIEALKFDYAVGVFNGSGPNIADTGMSKDLVARLKLRPVEWLSLGVSGALKLFDNTAPGQPRRGWAGGGDAKLSVGGFVLLAEAIVAEHNEAWREAPQDKGERSPLLLDVVGVASYKVELPTENVPVAVEPAFQYELLDPHSIIIDDEVSVFTPGVNIYIGKYLRFMIDGQFQRAARNGKAEYPDSETLWAFTCLDI